MNEPARVPSRETLEFLAERREQRMGPDGRPVFNLTEVQIASSVRTAMHLALTACREALDATA